MQETTPRLDPSVETSHHFKVQKLWKKEQKHSHRMAVVVDEHFVRLFFFPPIFFLVLVQVSKPNDEGSHKFDCVTLKHEALMRSDETNGQDPVVKLEFFHFKTSGDHRLLGHVSTTLETLRQVPPQGMLLFHSNMIPEGSVRGKVSVEQAEVTAARSYFVLHFQLGRTDVRRRLQASPMDSKAAASGRPQDT